MGPTFVLMSDHLWAPELILPIDAYALRFGRGRARHRLRHRALCRHPGRHQGLLPPTAIRSCKISKELPEYHALDTGVFKVTGALIEELERADGPEGCSLSQGVQALAKRGAMKAVSVGRRHVGRRRHPHGPRLRRALRWRATARALAPCQRRPASPV